MKKLIYAALICICHQVYAQTNQYIPFPDEGCWSIWKVEYDESNTIKTQFDRTMKGDTIINGLSYKKYFDPVLKSAIRNDVPNKKVYCYDFALKKDSLMYDFNLKVGDTVLVMPPNKYWVAEIDSVLLLDKVYHNRYKFNRPKPIGMGGSPQLSPLIEGLGYFAGSKFEHFPLSEMRGIDYTTVCASGNKKLLIAIFGTPPSGEYCGTIINDIEDAQSKETITLFPNPTNAKLEIRTVDINVVSVEVMNVLGSKIESIEWKGGAMEIDLINQPSGIYFIRLIDKNGISFTRKILKTGDL